jgi:Protein of unknown function (DUF4038)/Domain of unknown function (DUF5060)
MIDMNCLTRLLFTFITLYISVSCTKPQAPLEAEQWNTIELVYNSDKTYTNPYTDVDMWAEFINKNGETMLRPAFWNGGHEWVIRFAPPDANSLWTWTTYSTSDDKGLTGRKGSIKSVAYNGDNQLMRHGLLKMSPQKRNVVHADGTPFLVVGDTPWSIPFRATTSQVKIYADDRMQKGFNTALLMSLQPDRYAEGPNKRDTVYGFERAFDDLPDGHLSNINTDYFQYVDSLMTILVDHGIVPVYQPVFHGFGWKGKTVLGTTVAPDEYARYCKYLVARYGSMPAMWLVSGDGTGLDPGVKPGGEAIEKWDSYQQPTGIHYSPADNYLPDWAQGDSTKAFHQNRSHHEEPWLDFQWAQTGHGSEHDYSKVERMYDYTPTKASMNGEPTYEGMGGGKLGLGWWQGVDAWNQLMHGGTMGVVYGAAALWQWKTTSDEPGWETWTDQPLSWREAIDLEGSKYVGFVTKAFRGYDFTDMEKRWDLAAGKPLLAKEGKFYISFLENGGALQIKNLPAGLYWHWFNPKTGQTAGDGNTSVNQVFESPDGNAWVLIVGEKK